MGNHVYTIEREFGSGGHEVGKILSEKLGIKFYDSELLTHAAKESGLCEEIFQNHDEKPTSSFLYSLVMDSYSGGYSSAPFMDMPLNHRVFLAQFDAIKKLANTESCVIVGRCADYALADYADCISIFIHADIDDRINTVCKREDVTMNKARDMCQKKDKQRASYYNYYSNKKWGDARCFDLCLNTSMLTLSDCADMIIEFRNRVEKAKKA
ncbi:MAG: cytidylate kinase-like family protein [Clostridiales bacterium]|nr:cytidylate kinase-like family protein [Clostridiales bacterium]